jgi:hypothetical protein
LVGFVMKLCSYRRVFHKVACNGRAFVLLGK